MSLLFLEGFEGYNGTSDMIMSSGTTKWIDVWIGTSFGHGEIYIDNSSYRTTQVTPANSRSMYILAGNSGTTSALLSLPSLQEFYFGVGVRFSNIPTDRTLFVFAQTSSASQGMAIHLSAGGLLQVSVPNSSSNPGTVLATGTQPLSLNVWYYIEVRLLRGGAGAGIIEVRVNGTTEINLTTNTTTGLTQYNVIYFSPGPQNGYTARYDDIYVCSTAGSVNNTFLGPISVFSLLPTGAGSSTQFTAVGAATNWETLNEATSNTTTYVESMTTGHQDYYTFEDLPAGITGVPGVMMQTRNNAPDAGVRKIVMNMKNGPDVVSSSQVTLGMNNWVRERFISETAPDGTPWTKAAVDATEGGIEAQ